MRLIESFILTIISILAPLKAVVISVILLVIVDTILGVLAARKSGDEITSSKLKNMIYKLLIYYTAILVGFVSGKYLIDGIIPIEKMITTLVGVVEVKSILENLDIIYGGSFFKSLVNKLSKKEEEDNK